MSVWNEVGMDLPADGAQVDVISLGSRYINCRYRNGKFMDFESLKDGWCEMKFASHWMLSPELPAVPEVIQPWDL